MKVANSKNNIPTRLSEERWQHISTGHPEMADFYFEILETIENPIIIYKGKMDELIAVSHEYKPTGKFFVVVYKEENNKDGFVITAFLSNKQSYFKNKEVIWKQ